jgi:hypothetical protein
MPPSDPVAEFQARRYVLIMGALAGGVMALLAALNFWVDPGGYFSRNTLGFYSVTAERQFKWLGLRRHPNDAVLLGDSKAAMANTAPIRQPFVFFNAGVGASMIEDVLATLKRVSPTSPLVVVELDYLQFNNTCAMGARFAALDSTYNAMDNLFSLQVTGSSFKTLAGALGYLPHSYLEDGTFVPTRWFEHYDQGDSTVHAQMLANYETLLRGYRIVPERVALLEALRAALEARGKPYLVYIHPTNAEEMVIIRRVGLDPAFEAWRARVHQVFPQVTDLTNSTYSDPKNYYRQDVVHPYPDIGGEIIQKEVLPKLNP